MRDYENLKKVSENREKQRAYYIPENKGAYTLLNGKWNFKYFSRDVDYDGKIDKWDEVNVPSCWQNTGYEKPNYTNVAFQFPVDPPYVPDDNPLGVYMREFEILDTDKKHYIVFEGVSSCVYLYINDKYVGFSQGSRLQAEFDISGYVKKGKNTITAKVLKWCCGTYLEDQDAFRCNGIFRDVYLLERPKGHIKDISVTTDKNTVNVDFEGRGLVKLFDGDKLLCEKNCSKKFTFDVENPVCWNAEKPYLYTLVFEYEGEVISIKFGFVTIKISSEKELLINGKSVKLKGVNHHDTSAKNGWYMTDEEIYNDLVLMKKLNINTIRTSHYPPTPKFLNYCDELGFYVVLENDMESHGFCIRNGEYKYDSLNKIWPCTNPDWNFYLNERMERTINRDKNHPSIFMWSVGNESGYGINMRNMLNLIHSLDKKRLAHCEDACHGEFPVEYEPIDVYSRMYLPIDECAEYAENKANRLPVFLCEYSHSMGNGPGDVYDYVESFYAHKAFIGGCIWEWADHVAMDNGVQKYGGDFDDLTHDYNFCCDGMVFSDRTLKAGSYEIKHAYQNVKTAYKNGKISLTNRFDFTNFNEYTFKFEVEIDGKIFKTFDKKFDVSPAETVTFDLGVNLPQSCILGAYLNIYMYDKTGYECAQSQHNLNVPVEKNTAPTKLAELKEEKLSIKAKGKDFEYSFSKHYGNFESLIINGEEKLLDVIKLGVWYAPTDNDRRVKYIWGGYENSQKSYNLNKLFSKVYSCEIKNGKIVVTGSLAGIARIICFKYKLTVSIYENGEINFDLSGERNPQIEYLPRLGFEIKLPKEDDKFRYFACGSGESYIDMHHHAKMGLFESSADNEYVNYVKPQDHGNHYNAKMLDIENSLKFKTDNSFEFSVSHYNAKTLEYAKHTDELVKDNATNVRIDYKHSGLGSASCGPALSEKYRLNEEKIKMNFWITK